MNKLVYILVFLFAVLCGCSDNYSSDDITDEYAIQMQQFVADIANYARTESEDFIIIPQNGVELAFNGTNPAEGINWTYLHAIDGIGIEELFYNGTLSVDTERLSMLQTLRQFVTVMVSDYALNSAQISDAIVRSQNEGFITFPRNADNYAYSDIPAAITDESKNDVLKLSDAANYLYLISTDRFSDRTSMLHFIAATNYDVVLIDPYFNDTLLTFAEIGSMSTKANGGKRLVIAYLNIGAAENWRPYWQPHWKEGNPAWLKKSYDGYPNEIWVEYWNEEWRRIIFGNDASCVKKVIDAGFNGAYLDNVEGYYFLNNP